MGKRTKKSGGKQGGANNNNTQNQQNRKKTFTGMFTEGTMFVHKSWMNDINNMPEQFKKLQKGLSSYCDTLEPNQPVWADAITKLTEPDLAVSFAPPKDDPVRDKWGYYDQSKMMDKHGNTILDKDNKPIFEQVIVPTDPQLQRESEKITHQMRKSVVSRKISYENFTSKLTSIIWGQLNDAIQNRMNLSPNFVKAREKKNPIDMLCQMREVTISSEIGEEVIITSLN